MVIGAIITALATTIVFASCQSNVGQGGDIVCTMEDCSGCTSDCTSTEGCAQNCAATTFECNGTAMNCSQCMCYGQVYDCGDNQDCASCMQNCTTTCTGNCVEQNCQNGGTAGTGVNCAGGQYVSRDLTPETEYKIITKPEIYSHSVNPVTSDTYSIGFTFRFDVNILLKDCKNVEIRFEVNYYDESTGSNMAYVYETKKYTTVLKMNEAESATTIFLSNVPKEMAESINNFSINITNVSADVWTY